MKFLFTIFLLFSVLNCISQTHNALKLEDFIVSNTFRSKTIEGINSMNDGIHFTSLKNENSIVKYAYKTGEAVDTIFCTKNIKDCEFQNFSAYSLSDNEMRILIETDKKKIYRHSYTANYFIWDILTKSLTKLSENGAQQAATFSPDGERVAFVRDNNIFIKTIRFGTEQQVTFDGKKNEIINGIPDWVYEEEFSYNKAFDWSPDSKMLAFVKFNETDVPEFIMPIYKGLSPENIENALYPGKTTFKYPKAGEKNSEVSVHIYDVKSKTTIAAKTENETNKYIPRIRWTPDGNNLSIMVLNRFHNELKILYTNPFTGDTRTILTEKNKRYIDESFLDLFTFLKDGENFVVVSERDGWSHLYLYKNTGLLTKQLTTGNFDVTDFYGYNPDKKIFYYQAAKKSPLQREIYSLSIDGKKDICLSEELGTNEAIFSMGYKYFINTFSNFQTPKSFTVNDTNGKKLRTIENNQELKEKLVQYSLPSFEFFNFVTSFGDQLNGYMIKPSNFEKTKKYPVVMTQYSGPNSQEVCDSWNFDWHYYLAQQGYIIACIDSRGTAARGEEFRKCTYLQLGKLESEDQVEAAKYLASLPYINEKAIAIWGWSYGGFITTLALEKGGDVFKAGVAVAPVTNWRFYDTVYTERFMRTPQQNPEGYDNNSPINNVKGITGNLLLIHGTADDNVHMQNTYEFTEALVQANIPFDMHIYTNRNHSISGGNTQLHLYNKIIRYFDSNLK